MKISDLRGRNGRSCGHRSGAAFRACGAAILRAAAAASLDQRIARLPASLAVSRLADHHAVPA